MIGASYSNKAFLIYGNSSIPQSIYLTDLGTNSISLVGASDTDFGSSVSNIGDFNNDGIDDIFVGAASLNNGYGGGYVIFGGKNLPYTISSSSFGTYGKKFIFSIFFKSFKYRKLWSLFK